MEFSDYGQHIRRNWKLLVGCLLLGLVSAAAASALMAPVYQSTTKLFVATQSSGSVLELQQGNNFTQQRVQSYVLTASTPLVLQPVIDNLGLPLNSSQLANKLQVSAELNTVVIAITASDATPEGAARIASGVAESLMGVIGNLESTAEKTPLKLTVVAPAEIPLGPASPNILLNLVIGLIVGLAVGIGAAVLGTVLDTKIRSEADLKRITDGAVLGGVPHDPATGKKSLITHSVLKSARAEAFRQVRTNLQYAHFGKGANSMLVTSAIPGEGKSTSCIHLALTLAETGQSVVIVDADLRRPSVAGYLGLEQTAGLTTALIGRAEVDDLLQPYGAHGVHVLASGHVPPNPSELLGSKEMTELIRYLEGRFDHVLLDAPPLLPVTDAAVLAPRVGGVVLVVGARQVRLAEVRKALASLSMVDARLLGIVLNRLPGRGPDSQRYGYGSYQLSEKEARTAADAEALRTQLRVVTQLHPSPRVYGPGGPEGTGEERMADPTTERAVRH